MAALASEEAAENGLARRLASSDKTVRDKAIGTLIRWISLRNCLADEDWKKLWKGMFYSMWHSDKAEVQAELAERISGILQALQPEYNAVNFFKFFLWEMRREWNGIDKLRLDKFYVLVTSMLREVLLLLVKHQFEKDLVLKFMDTLVGEALITDSNHQAMGMNYHIADVFVQELKQCKNISSDALELLLDPFIKSVAESKNRTLLRRLTDGVFNNLADIRQEALEDLAAGKQPSPLAAAIDPAKIYHRIFVTASLNSDPTNRKVLYEISARFRKLCTKCGIVVEGVLPSQSTDPSTPAETLERRMDGGRDVAGKNSSKKQAANGLEPPALLEESGQEEKVRDVGFKDSCAGAERQLPASPLVVVEGVNGGDGTTVRTKRKQGKLRSGDVGGKGNKEEGGPKREEGEGDEEGIGSVPLVLALPSLADTIEPVFETVEFETGEQEAVVGDGRKVEAAAALSLGGPRATAMELDVGTSSAVEGGTQSEVDRTCPAVEVGDPSPVKVLEGNGRPKRKRNTQGGEAAVDAGRAEDNPATPGSATDSMRNKKVRFSLKSNMCWKKTDPVPPPSVRTPPSAAPRGSALKKGVLPGPINKRALKSNVGTTMKRVPKILVSPTPSRLPRSKRLLKMLMASLVR